MKRYKTIKIWFEGTKTIKEGWHYRSIEIKNK